MRAIYRSRIEGKLFIALLALVGGVLALLGNFLLNGGIVLVVFACIAFIILLLLTIMVFSTKYKLYKNSIHIKSWPFVNLRIPYAHIFSISTADVFAANRKDAIKAAFYSKEGLLIHFKTDGTGNTKDYVYVSPMGPDVFMEKIKERRKETKRVIKEKDAQKIAKNPELAAAEQQKQAMRKKYKKKK